MADQARRRVVIVGGGFAGLFAARALRRAPVQVTLIDRAEHHLFQPLLYQCATGILSEGKIAAPLRELLKKHHNVEFVLAEVTGIDAGGAQVHGAGGRGARQIEFGYDYLIVAAGVRQSYFGHDEFAAFAPGMKSIEDALNIRRRVFGAFEMAESRHRPGRAPAAGSPSPWSAPGPTGVELAGQIREVATKTLRPRVPAHQPGGRPGAAVRRGQRPAGLVRPRAVRQGRRRPAQAGRRAAHGLHRHRGRPVRAGGPGQGRQHHPARRGHRAVDRRGRGAAAGRGGGRGDRREPGPGRADPGQPGPDHPRPPGDPRDRRHDEPGQAARGGRGGHAGRPVRGPADQARAVAGPPETSRSATTTWARPPTSPAAGGDLGRQAAPSGFLGWWGWLFIHIAFITGSATGSARCCAGGSPSPATCARNAR